MASTGAIVGALVGATVGFALLVLTEGLPSETDLHTTVGISSRTAVHVSAPRYPEARSYATSTLSEITGPQEAPLEKQETQWKNFQRTLFAFAGIVAAFNAAALYYLNHRSVSIAALTGEKDEEMGLNRRQLLVGMSAAGAFASSPAHALFGFGEDAVKIYTEDTTKMLNQIKSVLVLDNNDPTKPDQIVALRRDMNGWVAKYRRDQRFSGRASYGNLYSVINAIAGHYTNFGPKTPIPKKRATQIVTEIGQAEQLLAKGR